MTEEVLYAGATMVGTQEGHHGGLVVTEYGCSYVIADSRDDILPLRDLPRIARDAPPLAVDDPEPVRARQGWPGKGRAWRQGLGRGEAISGAPEPPFTPSEDRRCKTCNWFDDRRFCSMYQRDMDETDGADCALWADPVDCDDDEE